VRKGRGRAAGLGEWAGLTLFTVEGIKTGMKWWTVWLALAWTLSAEDAPERFQAAGNSVETSAAAPAEAPVAGQTKPWEKPAPGKRDPSSKVSRAVQPHAAAGGVAEEPKVTVPVPVAAETAVTPEAKPEAEGVPAAAGPVIETGPMSQAPTKTEEREGATLQAEGSTGAAPAAEGAAAAGQTVVRTAERPPMGPWDLPVQLDPSLKIKQVYDFLNDPKFTKTGENQALEYEFKYFNHGAVTEVQRHNRVGQYYVVSWANTGDARDLVLRMDYRQGKSREQVKTIEIPYAQARGDYKGTFAVTGDEYFANGQLLSWRIALVRDGVIVAQERSFVW
jgi:hypothetical protein